MFFALRDAITCVRNERGLKKTFALNSPLTAEQIRAACIDDFTKMVIGRWGNFLFNYL